MTDAERLRVPNHCGFCQSAPCQCPHNDSDIPGELADEMFRAASASGRIRYEWLCGIYRKGRAAALEAQAEEVGRLRAALEALREKLWLGHGHGGAAIYGDDGEMQCHQCQPWDYLRAPLAEIVTAAFDSLRAQVTALQQRIAHEDESHGNTIDERDRAQEMADRLAEAIVGLTVGGDVIEAIGEHTSANCPWAQALELAEAAEAALSRVRGETWMEAADMVRTEIRDYSRIAASQDRLWTLADAMVQRALSAPETEDR